jgi:amino acid adenylation domain-containing protein
VRGWLARAVATGGDAVAIEAPDGAVTWGDFGRRVDALVAVLKGHDVRPGDRIGVAAERSVDTVVNLVATLSAGCGYVPLDLSYPADRLASMLDDARPRAVLGGPGALETLARAVGTFPTLAALAPSEALHGAADDLAYVLFTSGSTGRPKGVAMGGAPLLHLIRWHAADSLLGRPARTLQFAPFSFDVHFQEVFSTLACAGTLVLVSDATRRDPRRLREAMHTARVERVFLPYAALQMIASASGCVVPGALREIVCAGESLQLTPAIRGLLAALPGVTLHNHYGPTETHVVTADVLDGDPAGWPDFPTIGRALPHVRVAVRDADGRSSLGPGEGELLIGGEALAHGYIGRPALSAERFLEDVQGLDGRWYATGDRVEHDTDGGLRYLGRLDEQVKIDGHRVEPGEIEAVLTGDVSVADAAVVAVDVPGAGRMLVAHVVPAGAGGVDAPSLRARLRARLASYMVPSRFVTLERLPTTPSGKIDRRALSASAAASALPAGSAASAGASASAASLAPAALIRHTWQELLGVDRLADDANLFDLGARSLLVLRFLGTIEAAGLSGLGVGDVYDRPTVRGLVAALQTDAPAPAAHTVTAAGGSGGGAGIAIVGFATRSAGADDVASFWDNLVAGREGIRRFAPHELDASVPEALRNRPDYVAARGTIQDPARFDAAFFGVPAREATLLDPQQRMLLELSWSALEHAGIDTTRIDGTVGVYAGTANNTYIGALRAARPELVGEHGEFSAMLASEKDYAATRIAHRLDLRGPAVSVHTACSTGLVAVAQAWHALAGGQCDVALAGGATVIVPQEAGYVHVEGAMESADGRCRPFDANASGTVFASAGAVVVLKRLEDAHRDGDTVYAIVRGVGLGNDGGDKASFTAPSVSGQAAAITKALRTAGVDPRTIGYVEAHGTGTALGDPIEVAALARAWRAWTPDTGFCALGSLKGNLGHTVAAAGVLGLIKAALALHHEVIPRTLHFERPNPRIDFAGSPFVVVAENAPWRRSATPRRAAVSSFGVGGTNAHAVLEEGPAPPPVARAVGPLLLPLSARTAEDLAQRAAQLVRYLDDHPDVPLAAVAVTLARGRRPMPHRAAVVARSAAEAAAMLRAKLPSFLAAPAPRVVFLMPGQGAQRPGMARGLYAVSAVYRDALERVLSACRLVDATQLRAWLLDAGPDDTTAAQALARTRNTQPALFATCYATAVWLQAWGVRPDALIGHSVGELAAACVAGVMSPEDAMRAVEARGAAMDDCPTGAMLAVRATQEVVRARLAPTLEIAGLNAPGLLVVAGPADAIDALEATLAADGIESTRLRVSHAFHSAAMDGALPAVERVLAGVALNAPRLTMYSCVTGRPLQAEQACDPAYWARQLREPVRFSDAVGDVLAAGDAVFIEVGPGRSLRPLVRQHRTAGGEVPAVVAMPAEPATDDAGLEAQWLARVGELWCLGVEIAWPLEASAPRATLPAYPFRRTRYWFDETSSAAALASPHIDAATPSAGAAIAPLRAEVTMSRIPRLRQALASIFAGVSGAPSESIEFDVTFVDQGLDSLSLTQAVLEIEQSFGLRLRFRRLMEDLDTPDALARHLDAEIAPDRFAAEPIGDAAMPAAVPSATVATPLPSPSSSSLRVPPLAGLPDHGPGAFAAAGAGDAVAALHDLARRQTLLMSQHFAVLAGLTHGDGLAVADTVPDLAAAGAAPADSPRPGSPRPDAPVADLIARPFGASARIVRSSDPSEFGPAQRAWLDDFVRRYVARTGRSKAFAQANRARMADPRVVTGFNRQWKDLVYPIVADRSSGACIVDIDGNEYIDLLSCFGANLLGYGPEPIRRAMIEQIERGLEVGPQHPLAAEVADLIAELTGMARVAFCNTGSEAVMGALRIARTVTGRRRIAVFTDAYHGIFDEVIVRGGQDGRGRPAAPGIPASSVEHVLVLEWASEASLATLREQAHDLAAIFIEPVQNKHPDVQPQAFVRALREIADAGGCALVFDEVVTGFRVRAGGAQELYGVRADIATYGKVIGGGLPLAAIAGDPKWLDALDGGDWRYGDDSHPEAGVTYFAGTFVRHPLALAAAREVLRRLKAEGPAFYVRLEDRTRGLVDRLNQAFVARSAPVRAVHCASLWRLAWDDGQRNVSLFYYLARFGGLHLYEQFGHFVTDAMGETEIARIVEVFTAALDELMAVGLIPRRAGSPAPRAEPLGSGGAAAHGDPKHRPDTGPLAPGQTERWLAACVDTSARTALNESLCLILEGEVSTVALEAAANDVLARHDAFRIAFDSGEPRQRVVHDARCVARRVDLSGHSDPDAALDVFCVEASRRAFELEQAPLAALSLIRLSDGRHVVHLVASHLVFDGWASATFVADLAVAYRARLDARAPGWGPAASPIAFAERQARAWASPQTAADRVYWRERLAHPPEPPALGDLAPAQPRRYGGDTLRAMFDATTLDALRARARAGRATLFQVLLACVAVAVRRRTGQYDFVIAVPFAGQALEPHALIVADGVLELPLRLDAPAGADFDALLAHTRTHLMDALEHPRVTQAAAARELGLLPTGDRSALTGVLFNLNPRLDATPFSPLKATLREGRKMGLLGELLYNFYEAPQGLTLDLHYSTDHVSPARASSLVDELQAVMIEVAGVQAPRATPELARDAPPAASPELSEAVRWNRTDRPYDASLRLGDLVRRGMSLRPDAVAVRFEGRELSYRELDTHAWALARRLRGLGTRPGDLVGICLERSVEMVVALVGTVFSGGAWVPIDPDYPRERIAGMCEDAVFRAIVTGRNEGARMADVFPVSVPVVELDAATPAVPCDGEDALVGEADNPAYVIFTSGSTGRPKGAVNTHAGVVNWLLWMQDEYALQADARVVQKTPYSFDVSLREFFWPLCVGATIVVARPGGHRDAEYLADLMRDERITLAHFVPSMLRLFLEEPGLEARCAALQRVVCSGEALPLDLVERFFDRLPRVRLCNLYGPTEAAVEVSHWECRRDDPRRLVPIGHPVANTRLYLLDAAMRPVAAGLEGDLYIAGRQVGLGYLARPGLTAERFLSDPFRPGERMYRTGDVARRLDDGAIEYLGRSDDQVKLRGHRVELGEIEGVLIRHPDVERCVVVAREFAPGDLRLVAYVVVRGAMPDEAALRAHVAAHLPEVMVPPHWMALESIPLLSNGKIDRKSLPAPAQALARAAADKVAHAGGTPAPGAEPAPSADPTVATIGREMATLLGRDTVGPDEHFFRLGGHSLLAAQLSARLGVVLGRRPGLRAVFEAPTPAGLARVFSPAQAQPVTDDALTGAPVGASPGAPSPSVDPPDRASIPRRTERTSAPLSLQQQRLWFNEHLVPGTDVNHVPAANRLLGELDLAAFERAWAGVVARHEVLRTVIEASPSGDRQRVLDPAEAPRLIVGSIDVTQPEARESRLADAMTREIGEPFEVSGGPLHRARLWRMGPREHVFFFMAHHLVWDGWSFDLLYAELAEGYEAHRTGRAPDLAPLPVSYGDFAAWQAEPASGAEIVRQVAHWTERLSPLPAPIALPLDRPRPAVMSGRGGSLQIGLDDAAIAPLQALASAGGTTLNVVLLAVYAMLLHRTSAQADLVIGTPFRGREQPQLEPLLGFFVNMLPLRSRFEPSLTLRQWIARTHAVVVEAFASPDVPFEALVRRLNPPRDPSRPLLHQVSFSFQDARGRPTRWGNLDYRRIETRQGGASQDLALACVRTHSELELVFTFNADVFAAAGIGLIARRFAALLQRVAAFADLPMAEVDVVAGDEAARIAAWNATDTPLPTELRVHRLVSAQAARTPDAPAVAAPDGTALSYAELERRSNRIARALRARGVRRGCLVGLCLLRHPDTVAALLGILKAGAAYVPLDPAYPSARLVYMAQHARLSLRVCESGTASVADWPEGPVLRIDDDRAELDAQADSPLPPEHELDARPDDPAYVIFTSGSTGQPKGVVVPHGAVANFLLAMAREPGIAAGDRIVALTTLSFDISVLEVFGPLIVGACVVVATAAHARDGSALAALLAASGATLLQGTPTTWRMLREVGWRPPPDFRGLVGGEPLPVDLAIDLLRAGVTLWNLYGPTEATVWCTVSRVERPEDGVSIGRPIANLAIHILDEAGRPCPIGTPGELWIGGAGVATGYLGRPELTAERFVPDPFSPRPGARLYRSGDLGRWRPDGSIEHHGRIDAQVKLRGHRIELGEIEAVMATHPQVARAVVALRGGRGKDDLLAGYVVPRGTMPADSALREHLRAALPEYMVPQVFVAIESVPLSAAGKVDRAALPEPVSAARVSREPTDAPTTDRERAIAEIWSRLLGVDSVGVGDNFYDLGGHSLLAMRVATEFRREFGVPLDMRRLVFETLGQIAAGMQVGSAGDVAGMPPRDTVATPARKGSLLSRMLGRRSA